jgi:hypothetical protein
MLQTVTFGCQFMASLGRFWAIIGPSPNLLAALLGVLLLQLAVQQAKNRGH